MGEKSDRFTWGPGELHLSQCVYCDHKHKTGATCDAYPPPATIPDDILSNEVDHSNPHSGDHGIQFSDRQYRSDLIQLLPLKAQRGSKPRCHLLTLGSPEKVAARLSALIKPFGKVQPSDAWMPQGFEHLEEAQLEKAPCLLDSDKRATLESWWLATSSGRAKTPNWDIASTCTIESERGLLLVEAKAHDEELRNEEAGKRLSVTASADSYKNHMLIGGRIEEANRALTRETDLPWQLSRDHHYQMSNRFTWAWKLTDMGVPVILVYLGFLKADEMKDRGRPFTCDVDWQDLVRTHSTAIPAEVWNRPRKLSGQTFVPLLRTMEIPLP
jgi:hypothetical protein